MDEYINREDVLKCLEYNTIQKPSANDVEIGRASCRERV